MHPYYRDKQESLKELFGPGVELVGDHLRVGERYFPIIDDVIVLLEDWQLPGRGSRPAGPVDFAPDIQATFGREWTSFPEVLPQQREDFDRYFDLVRLGELASSRVADLGCGAGRWSHFLSGYCRELVLVDFSEAIFVARRNLRKASHALFFMADIRRLPFQDGCFDLVVSLGVLHHLPTNALDEVRRLARLGPQLLIYLYYDLDNRPGFYRLLLAAVTHLRLLLVRIHSETWRVRISRVIAAAVYLPLVHLGQLLAPLGLGRWVPLYEAYSGKSFYQLHQDAYDRFFTSIEQRFSRVQIEQLGDTFSRVMVSPALPYWHFLCSR